MLAIKIPFIAGFFVLASLAQQAFALPIGFGRNQGDLEYQELKSDHFRVYFDKRNPQEGRAILHSLEAAKPILEHWLEAQRNRPLPVIMSATTDLPSFANFITDALELQTLGDGGRDLAWHELTHNIMYRHLANILGPTGAIIHLPWLPAWWIEGLAELSSRSVGSDLMFGIERYFANTQTWPSYDKLHSLYRSNFATVGYALSGSFTDYIIRTYGPEGLGQLMRDFYRYSMPWWWPVSVVPFVDFMPWDAALQNYTGKTGAELYEEYKKHATEHWLNADIGPFHFFEEGQLLRSDHDDDREPVEPDENALEGMGLSPRFSMVHDLDVRGNQAYIVRRYGKDAYETRIEFGKNGLPRRYHRSWALPKDSLVYRAQSGNLKIGISRTFDNDLERYSQLWLREGEASQFRHVLTRNGEIGRIFISQTHIIWLEREYEQHRLCLIPKMHFLKTTPEQPSQNQIKCPLETRYPGRLNYLGQHYKNRTEDDTYTSEIFLALEEETLVGDRARVFSWSTDKGRIDKIPNPLGGRVLSVSKHEQGYDLLLASKSRRVIRHLSPDGQCLRQRKLADLAMSLHRLPDDQAIISTWYNRYRVFVKTQLSKLPEEPCQLIDMPMSPLMVAMVNDSVDLREAMAIANPWQETPHDFKQKHYQALQAAPALHITGDEALASIEANEAKWRGRPVFSFPWIGADAMGYQLGAISVPLMDHMQNETLRFSALYGVESRFPNLELSFLTTRYKTSYGIDVFRRQAWNGVFRGNLDGVFRSDIYYFDERGVKFNAYRYFNRQRLSLRLGLKMSELRPYIGPADIWDRLYKGYHKEIDFTLSQGHRLPVGSLGYFLTGAVAPEEVNNNIIYDRLGLGLNYNLPVSLFGLGSNQRFAVAYSRTRGKQQKLLREVYRPLRTFVPGSGGGFNEINVSMAGPGALTSAVYGDTQARAEFAWTFPVVQDLETLLHIFYLERLDFTAFVNYGRAWFGPKPPDFDQFVLAHGYNIDLQSDIKGVTVNLGLGVGQVRDQDFELYFLFGFDALID